MKKIIVLIGFLIMGFGLFAQAPFKVTSNNAIFKYSTDSLWIEVSGKRINLDTIVFRNGAKMWDTIGGTSIYADSSAVSGYADSSGYAPSLYWTLTGDNLHPTTSTNYINTDSAYSILDAIVLYHSRVNNIHVGVGAGDSNTANYCTFIGDSAGFSADTNDYMTATGYMSGYNSVGNFFAGFGYWAGINNTGSNLNSFGYNAGNSNSGDYVNAFGINAAQLNSGNGLSALGYFSGYNNSGLNVNSIGYESGSGNSGDYLNSIGYHAGHTNSGAVVEALGLVAAKLNTGNFVLALGDSAALSNALSNWTFIGKGDTSNSWINGYTGTGTKRIRLNGDTYVQNILYVDSITANSPMILTSSDSIVFDAPKSVFTGDADVAGTMTVGGLINTDSSIYFSGLEVISYSSVDDLIIGGNTTFGGLGNNILIGNASSIFSGSANVAIGYSAGNSLQGNDNIAIGSFSGGMVGDTNIGIGVNSGYINGKYNNFIGYFNYGGTGSNINLFGTHNFEGGIGNNINSIGQNNLNVQTAGDNINNLGDSNLFFNSGSNILALGNKILNSNTGSRIIAIGDSAGDGNTLDDFLFIGKGDTTENLINAYMGTGVKRLNINANTFNNGGILMQNLRSAIALDTATYSFESMEMINDTNTKIHPGGVYVPFLGWMTDRARLFDTLGNNWMSMYIDGTALGIGKIMHVGKFNYGLGVAVGGGLQIKPTTTVIGTWFDDSTSNTCTYTNDEIAWKLRDGGVSFANIDVTAMHFRVKNFAVGELSDYLDLGVHISRDSIIWKGASSKVLMYKNHPILTTATDTSKMNLDNINDATITGVLSVDSISASAFSMNGLNMLLYSFDLPNGDSITLVTGTGWGSVFADSLGYNDEAAYLFKFDTDGTVTLVTNTTDVANTDTAGKLCIYNISGAYIGVKNNLGTTRKIMLDIKYR